MAAVVVAVLTSLLLVAPAGTAGAQAAPETSESQFLQKLNAERCAAGLAPMALHAGLSDDARRWSATMSGAGSLHHSSTIGADTAVHLPDWRSAGENVGRGWSADSLHAAFMASPGHRANVLGDFNAVGIGVVVDGGGRTWVTVRFARSASVAPPSANGPFPDAPPTAYFGGAVEWMRLQGLTTGYSGSICFRPDATVTRAELATFVHRLAGSPAPGPRAPFPDVPTGAYFQAAVDWMYNQGLTRGVGTTGLYRPGDLVTRDQMAAVLHRLAGAPIGLPRHGFVDVAPTHFADTSVSWLSHHAITTGVAGTSTFQPGGAVTRGQLATFLHRLVQTPMAMSTAEVTLAVLP